MNKSNKLIKFKISIIVKNNIKIINRPRLKSRLAINYNLKIKKMSH